MSNRAQNVDTGSSLRALGGLEQWFYFMDRHRPNHFSIAASVTGALQVQELIAGLAQLQIRHPLLRVSIEHKNVSEASFVGSDATAIPVRIVERETEDQWCSELANEASLPFNTRIPPLIRAVLIHGPQQSDLILTIHHSVADGMGLFFVLRDLIAALSGEQLRSLPLASSIEEVRSNMLLSDPAPDGNPREILDADAYRSPEYSALS